MLIMVPQPKTKLSKKKVWIQPPITNFVTKNSRSINTKKTIIKPYLSNTPFEKENHLYNENISSYDDGAKTLVYNSPIVDMTQVVKDSDFYSMTPFEEDENLVAVKKTLFESNSKTDDTTTIKHGDLCDYDKTKTKKLSKKNPHSKPKDVKKTVDNEHGYPLPLPIDTTEHVPVVIRTKRAPNEIKVASLVFPVLIKEEPIKDLRQELESVGILEPFSFKLNGFQDQLEGFGLDEVKTFIQSLELDKKNMDLKTCFYCEFVTESSLVMGRHLDIDHKNRFKHWPFNSRMDFNMMK